jgi:signal transduction histidine kinase
MCQHVRPAHDRQPGRRAGYRVELTSQAHLVAGLGALVLGLAELLRDPRRRMSQLFAELCGCLAIWMLGRVLEIENALGRAPTWHDVRLLGGCLAAPQALRLVIDMAGPKRWWTRPAIVSAFVLALVTLVMRRLPVVGERPLWPAFAAVALGAPLAGSLLVLRREARVREALGGGMRLLVPASVIAVLAGLSDLIPRDRSLIPPLGPLGLIPFLIVLASATARRRFLDADRSVARLVAITLAAAAGALFLQAVVGALGHGGFAYFLACLVVVSASGAFVSALFEGTRVLLDRGSRAVALAITSAADGLREATDEAEAWSALSRAGERLPAGMQWHVLVAGAAGFVEHAQAGGGLTLASGAALARALAQESGPLALPALVEDPPSRKAACAEMERLGARAAVIVGRAGDRGGILLLGGPAPERWMSRDVMAALQAVAHQAGETLARVEAQRLARRREALAAVGELAAGLAHEVRNPIAAIHGAAQILGDTRDPEVSREMLGVIEEESRRLGDVLGEFLAWARPGSPRMTSVDLEEAVRGALREAEMAGFGLRAEVTCEDAVPPARADAELLRRAIVNILRNAREACGENGRLVIRVEGDADDGVRVCIEDDGPGLPEAVRARLFEPFVTTKARGTGLGLPLVHRVMTAMQGVVLVDSERARGAAFTLLLCAVVPPGHDAPPEVP